MTIRHYIGPHDALPLNEAQRAHLLGAMAKALPPDHPGLHRLAAARTCSEAFGALWSLSSAELARCAIVARNA